MSMQQLCELFYIYLYLCTICFQQIVSKSHRLEIVKNNKCIEITTNTLADDNKEDNIEIYGKDFELQYYFATETFSATLFMNNNTNSKDSDTLSHYLLISPQINCDAFDRSICFLIDRSTRNSLIWIDIIRAIEHCLDRMNSSDRFSIILYDATQYISWGTDATTPIQLHYVTCDKKKSAIDWMNVYKPDLNKLNSELEKPLYETLKLIKQSTSNTCGSYCVIIGSSYYSNEKDILNKMINLQSNYDSKGIISQRIYSISIGAGINKYFLNYLSLISRGKSIEINNPKTVYNELISFFNEFRSPMVCDIGLNIQFLNRNVSFKPTQMLHPYPISDLCFNHPIILKLTIPNDINQYKIKEITINKYTAKILILHCVCVLFTVFICVCICSLLFWQSA